MCLTSLLLLLGNEVEIRRDHSQQSIVKPSLFIEDAVSTVACFLFSFVCLVWFVLYDGNCNFLRVTSLLPRLVFLYLLMSFGFGLFFSLFVKNI